MRTITYVVHGNRELALVPLGRFGSKGHAVIDASDLAILEDLGLSMVWNRNTLNGSVFAPAVRVSGGRVSVPRVLLDLGEGQIVKYHDGDPTNLRRENLAAIEGNAIRRDRDFLTPKAERRACGPPVEHSRQTTV